MSQLTSLFPIMKHELRKKKPQTNFFLGVMYTSATNRLEIEIELDVFEEREEIEMGKNKIGQKKKDWKILNCILLKLKCTFSQRVESWSGKSGNTFF